MDRINAERIAIILCPVVDDPTGAVSPFLGTWGQWFGRHWPPVCLREKSCKAALALQEILYRNLM